MKKQLFILMLLIGVSLNAKSQITFQKTFTLAGGGNGYSVLQTPDGGYCAVGSTSVYGTWDVYLIRTNSNGDTLWTKTYGGPFNETGWFFQQTSDNGFIITGFSDSFGAGQEDIYLIRTDSNGDTLWTKTFGGPVDERGNCVQQTSDGGFIIAGFTSTYGAGNTDIILVKTDANGDTTWTKTFGGSDAELANFVQQTADGGYVITGVTHSFGAGDGDALLIKTDMNGDPIWEKTLGGPAVDYGYTVRQTNDGGYIMGGYTQSFGAGNDDFYLVKTDSIGDVLWAKTFGGAAGDRLRNLQITSDGGYIFTGWIANAISGFTDIYLVKTDTNGDVTWTNAVGGALNDNARCVNQNADGSYIITGGTYNSTGTSYDLYLIKVDPVGSGGCNQTFRSSSISSPTIQVTGFSSTITSPTLDLTSPATIIGGGSDVFVICTNVGIDETTIKNSFTVYPNPSIGDFVISFEETLDKGKVEIVNAIGEIVYSENIFNASEVKINQGNINSGIYFVRVFDGRKNIIKKIVVED